MSEERKVAVFDVVDDPAAPTVYSTGATGYWLYDGQVHMTFEEARPVHKMGGTAINRVVVSRVVMSLRAARGLAASLNDFLARQDAGLENTFPETAPKHYR